jgi:predicted nucleic acid-binding protein
MGQTRSYIDASLIIDAVSHELTAQKRHAVAVLDDTGRDFITSDYVWLETLPKMQYQKMREQIHAAGLFFQHADFVQSNEAIIAKAKQLAAAYGLAAIDALHAACAIAGGADELITCEKPTKPFFRIPPDVLKVVSIHSKTTASPGMK